VNSDRNGYWSRQPRGCGDSRTSIPKEGSFVPLCALVHDGHVLCARSYVVLSVHLLGLEMNIKRKYNGKIIAENDEINREVNKWKNEILQAFAISLLTMLIYLKNWGSIKEKF
jgi:hypothetical protein